MDKGSNPTRDSSLRTLVGGLTEAPRSLSSDNSDEAQLADDVMSALADSRRPVAYEAVATYVVARVEDVLTAVSGQENLSRQIVDIAVQDGFMPLTAVRGYKTIGQWLTEELRWELGDDDGDRVSTEFAGLLSGSESDDPAADIDHWLTSHFFRMHLKRTDGEPEVWHLSSKGGTSQALVYGRRLSKERLETFISNVVRRAIDEFQRQLEQARKDDELDEADRLEASLKDLHLFEVNLRTLEGGSSEEAKLRYPWRRSEEQPHGWSPIWSEGIRPNIAPLQRLGLLAAAVLTPDELSELQPTG
jgi:broad specificity phosphatase PhoE